MAWLLYKIVEGVIFCCNGETMIEGGLLDSRSGLDDLNLTAGLRISASVVFFRGVNLLLFNN